jgi:hypothetical protein
MGHAEMIVRATARREEFAAPADSFFVVFGLPFGHAGTTDNLREDQVGNA